VRDSVASVALAREPHRSIRTNSLMERSIRALMTAVALELVLHHCVWQCQSEKRDVSSGDKML
jgi:hypothetical protein